MKEKENELYSVEFYQETLSRLRVKLRDAQDSMDVISFAIKSLENGLEAALEKENEKDENA